jgi:hypothetical protein
VAISRAWENIKVNITVSTKQRLGRYGLSSIRDLTTVMTETVSSSVTLVSVYKMTRCNIPEDSRLQKCSELLRKRKQAKLQWLQNPNQTNGDNMDSLRREGSRTFRTKKKGISERRN